jgi:archaemetzincin
MAVELLEPELKPGKDFMATYEIPNRINQLSKNLQYHAGKILKATIPMIPKDAYCMLSVTMHDIYPDNKWNFVFGLAHT